MKIKEYLGQATLEINYTSQKGWKAIGNSTHKFTGEFDGQGNTIENLTIERPGGSAALFNKTSSNALIESLNLEKINYRGKRIGGIASVNEGGKLEKVTVKGDIESSLKVDSQSVDDRAFIGGLVGKNNGEGLINKSNFSGKIKGNSYDYVGGIVGNNHDSNVTNANSNLTINGGNNVGGLIGNSSNGVIRNSYSNLTIPGAGLVGGLVGKASQGKILGSKSDVDIQGYTETTGGVVGIIRYGTINNSHSEGIINGDEDNTGGLVGKSHVSEIKYSSSSAEVIATSNYNRKNYGGLIGKQYGGEVFRSHSDSAIIFYDETSRVGGLVGYLKGGTISQSYSVGSISLTDEGSAPLGGLVGLQDDGDVNNSYSTLNISGDTWASSVAGGLVGSLTNGGLISNSYSTGVNSDEYDYYYSIGGLVDYISDSTVEDSYWNNKTDTYGSIGAERSTLDMTWEYSDTYSNWDFIDVWRGGNHSIVNDKFGKQAGNYNNRGYPALQWQESVNLSANISGNSTVKVDGDSFGENWSMAYGHGDEVSLEAVPNEYWYFDKWGGDIDSTQKSTFLTLDEDKNVTAVFEEAEETYIKLDSNTSSVVASKAVNFSADVYDQYGNLMWDVTDDVSWSIEGSAGGSWSESVYSSENNGSWTVTGNYDGMSNTTTLDVQIGAVNRVSLEPDTDQSLTAGNSLEFSAEAFDSEDNLIIDSNPDFAWSKAVGGTFDNTEAGEYNVTTSYNGVSNDTNVTVNPASVSLVNAIGEKVGAGQNGTIGVKVEDSYGNPISEEKISIDVDDDLKDLEGSTGNETDGEGKAEFYFNETESGIYNLDLSSEGNSVTDTVKVNVTSAEPAEMVFNQQPSDTVAGEIINPAVTIALEDRYGNLVINNTQEVEFSVSESTGLLKGAKKLNFADGTAVFDNSYIESIGEYTISAETSVVDSEKSNTFSINSANVGTVNIENLKETSAGNFFNLTLEGLDRFNNPIDSQSITDVSIVSEHEGEIYSKDEVSFNQSGKAVIENLNLTVADRSNKIEIDASEISPYSKDIDVRPSNVDYFEFNQIDDQFSGDAFSFTLEAFDAHGNLATGYDNSVSLSDTTGTLSPETIILSDGSWTGEAMIERVKNSNQLEVKYEDVSSKSNEFDVQLFEINIDKGINTVSFPSKSGQYSLDSLVYDGIKFEDLTMWSYEGEWKRLDESSQIRGGTGYIIRSESNGKIRVKSEVLMNNGNKPSSVTLNETGWNLIGHYETFDGIDPVNVGENGFYSHKLDNVNSTEVKFDDYRQLVKGYEYGFNPANEFKSGEGYWVTVNWDRTYLPLIN